MSVAIVPGGPKIIRQADSTNQSSQDQRVVQVNQGALPSVMKILQDLQKQNSDDDIVVELDEEDVALFMQNNNQVNDATKEESKTITRASEKKVSIVEKISIKKKVNETISTTKKKNDLDEDECGYTFRCPSKLKTVRISKTSSSCCYRSLLGRVTKSNP